MGELYRQSARATVAALRSGAVSPTEAVKAACARIAAVEPEINAMPMLCRERALAHARRIESGEQAGDTDDPLWLGGLPIAVKDLVNVEGVVTTFGSPVFKNNVPKRSNILVERLEARGAIVVGMSNTPEFGTGGNTFNTVYGATRNPHDTRLSAGGSSGGSAAALAAGEVWLATGSDMGGSLRTPSAFCGVVGLRTSPGRIASFPEGLPFQTLAVEGPMGRDVADTALMLDAMAGFDPRDPLSIPAPGRPYQDAVAEPSRPRRIAWAGGLGLSPVDPAVEAVCRAALDKLSDAGWVVEDRCPDFSGAMEAFHVLRAAGYAAGLGPELERNRDLLKPEVIWNIEKGLGQSAEAVAAAERYRGALFQRMTALFDDVDLMVAPAAVIPPFPVEDRYPGTFAGRTSGTYLDWLTVVSSITLTASPVLALPAGRTPDGLPVGLQLVAPPRAEYDLLAAGAAAERLIDAGFGEPVDPNG